MFEGGQSMVQLREQSMQLLRDQASRLKMQSKEIQLRDEQVRFLKQTILALQQEKDTLQAQNAQWKVKLKQMAAEIAQYNTNVVQKIYDQNQDLLKQVADLEQQLEIIAQERDEAVGRLRESEGRLQSHSSQKQELSTVNEGLKEARSKQEKRLALLQKENKQLQTKNISLQRQLDQSSTQINYCSQQIDVLTQKHHDALKIAEKKLKQTTEKLVPREQLERAEKEARDNLARNKQLRTDLQKIGRDKQKLKFELASCRDRLLTLEVKEETKSQQLRTDMANLSQSIKIGKKVAEFQSQQHQTAAAIYEAFKEIIQKSNSSEEQLKHYAEKLKQAEIQQRSLLEQHRFKQIQLQRVKEAKAEDEQTREAEYEHRLIELGLRLKREEIALAQLRVKEDELEALREQREKEGEEHRIQGEAMSRTIEQLKKQNSRMGEELTSAIKLCEENILNRQCISYYKYVVQDLVGIAFYLHLHLTRTRQRSMKLFKPFINYYLAIHPSLMPADAKKKKRLNKFKSIVYVVIAIQRMRRERGKGRGLEWYAYSAGERRQKLENVGQHIEMLSNSILNGGKAVDLLRNSQNIYRWRLSNYLKVRLPIGDDRKIISECELQLDQD